VHRNIFRRTEKEEENKKIKKNSLPSAICLALGKKSYLPSAFFLALGKQQLLRHRSAPRVLSLPPIK